MLAVFVLIGGRPTARGAGVPGVLFEATDTVRLKYERLMMAISCGDNLKKEHGHESSIITI